MTRLDIKDKNNDVLYRAYYIEPFFDGLRRLVSEDTGESVDTLHISKESIRGLIQTNHDLMLMNLQPKWNKDNSKIKPFEQVKNIQPIHALGMGYDIDFRKKLNTIIKKGTSYSLSFIYLDTHKEYKVFDSIEYNNIKEFESDNKTRIKDFAGDIIIERVLRLDDIKTKQTIVTKVVRYFKELIN